MRLYGFLSFVIFYVWEILCSNFKVAHDVITPRHRMSPGIIAVPLDEMNNRQLMLMANLITMTPGTLSLDISEDRKTLYIHAMYLEGKPDELRNELKQTFEKRIRDVF